LATKFENDNAVTPPSITFTQALLFWLKLGCISFGGPAGQIAIMHSELVDKRRWISEKRFLHALNYCMVLPGPEAQQLATYIGWLLHGKWGGIAAGALFVLPSLVLFLAISAVYVAFGNYTFVAALFEGMKPAVVAIIFMAVVRIGSRVLKNWVLVVIAVAALIASLLHVPFPVIVLGAGCLSWLISLYRPEFFQSGEHEKKKAIHAHLPAIIDDDTPPPTHANPNFVRFVMQCCSGAFLWLLPFGLLIAWQGWQSVHVRMAWFFTSAALLTFGGAYAVLPYVTQEAVHVSHWLTMPQMMDGLALGETTPGPLIMIVSFVGFLGGWTSGEPQHDWLQAVIACLIATYFTFLPSFLFILIGAPFIESSRQQLRVTAALAGITAAVVGVIFNLGLFFTQVVIFPEYKVESINYIALTLAVLAFVALWKYKCNLILVILATAVIGLALHFFK
jgi:chromate transporter